MSFFFANKQSNDYKIVKSKINKIYAVFAGRNQTKITEINNDFFYLSVYKSQNNSPCIKYFKNGDFIIAFGTLFYDKKFKDECLTNLYTDFCNNNINLNKFLGNYAVIIFKSNKLYLFNDNLGLLRVYKNNNCSVVSTSFLATATSLNSVTPSSQEIFEYLQFEASFGDKTIVKQISLLPTAVVNIIFGEDENKKIVYEQKNFDYYSNFNKVTNFLCDELLDIFKTITSKFKNNIATALSGGYDSRLMFACLRHLNINPYLYVYGSKTSYDVKCATNICKNLNIEINHIDKQKYPKTSPEDFYKDIKDNFYYYDGFFPDGFIFDKTDLLTRLQRTQNGRLQLNGGAGEIFRNKWQLNSKPKNAYDFAMHQYNFSSTDYFNKDIFDKKQFFKTFSQKILKSVNSKNDFLTRKQIELAYPLFSVKYWQATNNSINLRFSNTLTPFVSNSLIYSSANIPVKLKYVGKLEAAMINKIDAELAKYTSVYGHSFNTNPSIKRTIRGVLIRNIPYSLKSKAKYKKNKNARYQMPYYFNKKYINSIVKLDKLVSKNYIDIEKIKKPSRLSRAYSLDYFFQNI